MQLDDAFRSIFKVLKNVYAGFEFCSCVKVLYNICTSSEFFMLNISKVLTCAYSF